ncbi:hypothetical protein DFH08DRAFT_825127 [Mycena albidolilacea]|uniref:Uncharacterized protein n=1 Tax=Mycena albidolilacea TaxID=1033008 RepID=A0AAD6Z328_9AGAR|nr:hypothetical protein DFH08DRAFT_825127 [Mycena albidolilacea]
MYLYGVPEGGKTPRFPAVKISPQTHHARDSSNASSAPMAAGTIILFTIMILALTAVAGTMAIWVWRRFRRPSPQGPVQMKARKSILPTVSPFDLVKAIRPSAHAPDTSSGARNSTVSTVRQQQLENELRAVQEKMVDLERHAVPVVDGRKSSGSHSLLGLLSVRSTETASGGSQDLVSQLEAARERNEALAARICELERQMRSEWALGISDEPPPGNCKYTGSALGYTWSVTESSAVEKIPDRGDYGRSFIKLRWKPCEGALIALSVSVSLSPTLTCADFTSQVNLVAGNGGRRFQAGSAGESHHDGFRPSSARSATQLTSTVVVVTKFLATPPLDNSPSGSSFSAPATQEALTLTPPPTQISTTVSVPPTSTAEKISAQTARHTLPVDRIVGIGVAIPGLLLIFVVTLSCWLRRRRKRERADHRRIRAEIHGVSDMGLHSSSSEVPLRPSPGTLRPQYLANELRAAQGKIAEMQVLQPRRLAVNAPRDGRLPETISIRSTSTTTTTASRLRERNEMLAARIRELEEHIGSASVASRSDEPLPGYRAGFFGVLSQFVSVRSVEMPGDRAKIINSGVRTIATLRSSRWSHPIADSAVEPSGHWWLQWLHRKPSNELGASTRLRLSVPTALLEYVFGVIFLHKLLSVRLLSASDKYVVRNSNGAQNLGVSINGDNECKNNIAGDGVTSTSGDAGSSNGGDVVVDGNGNVGGNVSIGSTKGAGDNDCSNNIAGDGGTSISGNAYGGNNNTSGDAGNSNGGAVVVDGNGNVGGNVSTVSTKGAGESLQSTTGQGNNIAGDGGNNNTGGSGGSVVVDRNGNVGSNVGQGACTCTPIIKSPAFIALLVGVALLTAILIGILLLWKREHRLRKQKMAMDEAEVEEKISSLTATPGS